MSKSHWGIRLNKNRSAWRKMTLWLKCDAVTDIHTQRTEAPSVGVHWLVRSDTSKQMMTFPFMPQKKMLSHKKDVFKAVPVRDRMVLVLCLLCFCISRWTVKQRAKPSRNDSSPNTSIKWLPITAATGTEPHRRYGEAAGVASTASVASTAVNNCQR